MIRRLRGWIVRTLAGGVVVACIVGPAPGNVGGCGASSPIANPREHCINERFWKCRRDLAGGRITMAQFDECLLPIQGACDPAQWPPGCEPTNSQSNDCLVLLSREDLVSISTPDLLMTYDDCNLCR